MFPKQQGGRGACASRPSSIQHSGGFMSISDMLNIGMMQGFAGLSLFSVLLLMGLGLAIIFGQMGVINMAHGEFMTIGAYTVYVFSKWAESMGVVAVDAFLPLAIVAAFAIAFVFGWVVEWVLI